MTERYVIRGRVRDRDDGTPVHGIRLAVRCTAPGGPAAVTSALSDARGHYTLSWTGPSVAGGVMIDAIDRDGKLVASRQVRERSLSDKGPTKVDVRVAPDALVGHVRRPLSWRDEGARTLAPHFTGEVSQAVALLSPRGTDAFDAMREQILCPGPLLPTIDDLIQLGWEVLTYDPGIDGQPMRRFSELLHAVQALDAKRPFAGRDATVWQSMVSKEGIERVRRLGRPSSPNAFGPDVLVPLLLPAAAMSAGDETRFAGYLSVLLRQLHIASTLGQLHGAAQRALTGDPDALVHFAHMIDLFGGLCGPDDGPGLLPDPGHDFHPIDTVADPACLADLLAHGAGPHVNTYVIDSVVPARACAGEFVTITGYGFDWVPEAVRFARRESPGTWIEVTPQSWSNEEIVVQVPPNAGCGLRLAIPPRAREVCGRYVDAWPDAADGPTFEGSAAEILNFSVNASTETLTARPGEQIDVVWRTCAADQVRVEIVRADDGTVLYERDGAAPNGAWQERLLECNVTTELTVRLIATGTCAPLQAVREITLYIHELPDLTVHGIEVTQAIQYYRADEHLSDPADHRDDNYVRLIAGKDAIVRAYLRSGIEDESFDGGALEGVHGWLTVRRIVDGLPEFVDIYHDINGPIDARASFPTYDDERSDPDASLNFRIPAAEVRGLLELTVEAEVSDPGKAPCGGGSTQHTFEVPVDLDQTLQIVAMPIAYDGEGFEDDDGTEVTSLPAPTEAFFVSRLDYTLKLFPVNETPDIRTTEAITIDFTLDGERLGDGGCSAAWFNFLAFTLLPAKLADGNVPNQVYIGLLPVDLPMNPRGCATFGVTGLRVNSRSTIAHEIGHILGRPHAPRGEVGSFDGDYPAYEPYDEINTPNASLGEYGFDIVREEVWHPATADLMSYGSPRWISLHTYRMLVQPPGGWLNPTPVSAGAQGDGAAQDGRATSTLVLSALLGDDDDIEVGYVSRFTTRPAVPGGERSGATVELLDEHGKTLSQAPLYTEQGVADCGCGDGGHEHKHGTGEPPPLRAALALLADTAPGALLRIRRGKRVLWERQAPARRPRVRLLDAEVSKRGRLRLQWEATSHSEFPTHMCLRWSTNRRDWRLLSTRLTGSRASLDSALLPPGRVYLELLLSDGFHTARAVSRAIVIPRASPRLAVLSPQADEPPVAGGNLRLWAYAVSGDGEPLENDAIAWELNGRDVGYGRTVWVEAPPPGRHRAVCYASVGRRRVTQEVAFETVQAPSKR